MRSVCILTSHGALDVMRCKHVLIKQKQNANRRLRHSPAGCETGLHLVHAGLMAQVDVSHCRLVSAALGSQDLQGMEGALRPSRAWGCHSKGSGSFLGPCQLQRADMEELGPAPHSSPDLFAHTGCYHPPRLVM